MAARSTKNETEKSPEAPVEGTPDPQTAEEPKQESRVARAIREGAKRAKKTKPMEGVEFVFDADLGIERVVVPKKFRTDRSWER